MKKIFLFLLLLSLYSTTVLAQPTQAEIDKMMKLANDAMKKYGNDSLVNKAMKDAKATQTQAADATKNQQGNNISSSYSDPGSYGNVDNWKFPPKNTALLASLPKKIFTKTELVSFLTDLYQQLSKKLPAGIASSVQAMTAKYKNDGDEMGDAAVVGWYTGYHEEATLLIIKAAANNPNNGLLLNNCAALLNMSGIEQKAIPILKYVLQSYPNNSMLLNNLGQAYAGLGEPDTAMVYLLGCMRITPEHAEACGTAGFIEESKGNTEKAVAYFEKSIKTAYSKTVELKLRKLKKGSRIRPLIRPRIKLPEYFNFFKYDLPAQCTSTDNAVIAEAEHNAFRKMITQQGQKYGAMYAELAQQKMQKSMQIMNANGFGRKLNKNEFMAQPYYELCNIMARDVLSDYTKELTAFSKIISNQYSSDISAIESEYQSKLKIINDNFSDIHKSYPDNVKSHPNCPSDEEKCIIYNNLANQYLPKFAYLTQEVQEKGKRIFNTFFDELVYWHYLSLNPISKDDFRMQYYVFIEQYLNMMAGLCQTKIIKPCNNNTTTTSKESNNIKEMDCPIDFALGLGIGKLVMNCEIFSISGGEVVIFGYEKNFKTKKSTVSVGIGIRTELGVKAGPFNVAVGAQATESIFITFDGNNGISDAGLQNEAKLTSDFPIDGRKELGVGSRFGINSGYDINEGPFKGKIGPAPEKQVNKNVPIYKPG